MILDDVDNLRQFKIIGWKKEWFSFESRIIITTRDKHLLTVCGIEKLCEVKELNDHESLELFSMNAFREMCLIRVMWR